MLLDTIYRTGEKEIHFSDRWLVTYILESLRQTPAC